MNFIKLLILTTLILSLGGCKQSRVKESLLPSSSGNPGEVVLIMEKTAWEGSAGESFRSLLQEETPGLPQREPLFNLVNIPAKAFTDLFKIHRNLIIVSIDPSIEQAGINVDYNRWSKPQLIITWTPTTSSGCRTKPRKQARVFLFTITITLMRKLLA